MVWKMKEESGDREKWYWSRRAENGSVAERKGEREGSNVHCEGTYLVLDLGLPPSGSCSTWAKNEEGWEECTSRNTAAPG